MEKQTRLVTRLELVESQEKLRKEMNTKVDAVDDKVDDLRDMVLPLIESNKHIERNTERTADIMEKFTDEQRRTNESIYGKLNQHDVSLTELGAKTQAQSKVKQANASIIVAVLGVIGILVGGIIGIAPLFF